MNIEARIKRRQRRNNASQLIEDYEPLSPVAHVDEPADRSRVLEKLLDHLEPVFDGNLPPNAYIYGPTGVGKSAVVTALFAHLSDQTIDPKSVIYTNTRVRPTRALQFVYVDSRRTTSEFAFYHTLVDTVEEEPVPEHGISTETLRTRLQQSLRGTHTGVVLAVDHVDEPGSTDPESLVDRFAALPSNVSWLTVGRTEPADTVLTDYTAESIRVDPYRFQVLVDVLITRSASGLDRLAIDHDIVHQLAEWADGNAHDAVAALFIAADRAHRANNTSISAADATAAIEEIPDPCISLGRVLALPANKQTVLRTLVDLAPEERATVTTATAAVSDSESVGLSPGTVKRYIYEMANVGIVNRVRSEHGSHQGRPPSRIEPRFPPTVFRRLYDSEQ